MLGIVGTFIATLLGVGLAFAGSQYGVHWQGYPLFALLVLIAYSIQWLAFIPAYVTQSERYYDITGSFSYLLVTGLALSLGPADPRSLLIALLVAVWALRLGTFLFKRVHQVGKDGRFDTIKPFFFKYLMTWTLQGMWVSFTLGAGLAAMSSSTPVSLAWSDFFGLSIWGLGFAIEVLADEQKRRHRLDPSKRGRFIRSGLWSISRHPNYLGEIILWLGIAVLAEPALVGWQLLTLCSPIFVYLLLTQVSGIPLLEARSDERWGSDPDYLDYKQKTPVLFPRFPGFFS